ncbi:MAG: thiamine pyrophosphate-binding protein [Egibacteraceae bacterium]
MNVAHALVQMLVDYDVRHIFGVPGDTTMALYDALYHARDRLTHVMGRDERSMAFAADAYARLTGRPGICEGPSGGGATYIVPGVAEAHGSSVPMVVLTSDVPVVDEGQGTLTAIDQARLLEAATKWRAVVKRPEMLPDLVRRAFRQACTGRTGAAHLVLPEDVLDEAVNGADLRVEPACQRAPAHRTQAPATVLGEMVDRLCAARRPMIVAGGGVLLSGAWDELTRLADLLAVPVGTTINGKGAIAETHPFSVGVVGGNAGRPYANRLLSESDCILYVGTKINTLVTLDRTVPRPDADVTVLQIDVDAAQLGNTLAVTAAGCGDAKASLAVMADLAANQTQPRRDRDPEHLRKLATGFWEAAAERASSDEMPLTPQRIVDALRRTTDDAVLVVDPGTMTPFVGALFPLTRPGRQTVIPRAHGGLGYAIPASVGAAFARPDQPVVAVTGDGSFGMSATELETIARLRLPVTVVQFTNGTFGWIKMLQKLYFDERYFGVDFSPDTNYVGVAEAFGVNGVRIEDPDQLEPAMRKALDSKEPWFIDVPARSELEEPTPVHAWQRAVSAPEVGGI